MEYFQAHVIQHLLLMVIAPPLLAMGAPMTLALQTSSRPGQDPAPRRPQLAAVQVLTHPVPVWFLYYFSMFAFFLTFALGFAMNHMWVMDLINLAFFFASTLFWWPIVGLDPIPHWKMSHGVRMANLLIGVPVESFLALALLSTTTPAASMYSLGSTHSGAGILWIGAELFTFLALIPVFVQWVQLRGAQRRPGTTPSWTPSCAEQPGPAAVVDVSSGARPSGSAAGSAGGGGERVGVGGDRGAL